MKEEGKFKQIICLDLPGFGSLSEKSSPVHIDKILSILRKQLKEKNPATRINTFYQLLAAKNSKVPESLNVPLLCLSSENDQMVDPECSLDLANFYGGENLINKVSGHDLTLDDPIWVIEKINDWLDRLELKKES